MSDAKGADALATLLGRLTASPAGPSSRPVPASKKELADAMARRERALPSPKAQATRSVAKGAPQKEVVKLPRHLREKALGVAISASLDVTTRPRLAAPNDMGAAAFQKVLQLRPSLDQFVASARTQEGMDSDLREGVDRLVGVGSSVCESIIDSDAEGYIGHDFGTSSTKAVVRWPYDRSKEAFAVPVPSGWSSDGIPHLWPTVVYLHPITGRFSLLPSPGSVMLSGFKSGLIESQGHRICAKSQATMAEAATAFLALHLAYVLGVVVDRRPESKLSGVNIGVPVAALANGNAIKTFSDVCRAAMLLIPNASALTLDDVKLAAAVEDRGLMPFELHTELAGAIAGYSSGPRTYLGSHMIIDCGSVTLDIASFELGNGRWPIAIHAAGVEPLGADACIAYQNAGATEQECRSASRHHEHRVFSATMAQAAHGFCQEDDRNFSYQVIVIGGGVHSIVHSPLFEIMERAFHRPFHRPALDAALVCEAGSDAGRLILADGLARSPIDLAEVSMPDDRPIQPLLAATQLVSKDQV